jgi:hypothetical protein
LNREEKKGAKDGEDILKIFAWLGVRAGFARLGDLAVLTAKACQ